VIARLSQSELLHTPPPVSPGMTASLRAGKIVTLPTVGLFADGAAVKTVGKETFNVCHQLVDEMITVQTGGDRVHVSHFGVMRSDQLLT
jgi:threonine dehydratase